MTTMTVMAICISKITDGSRSWSAGRRQQGGQGLGWLSLAEAAAAAGVLRRRLHRRHGGCRGGGYSCRGELTLP